MINTETVKIGIVEDEAIIADHLAMCLNDLGYHVQFIADNANYALKKLQEKTCDLLLVDINIEGETDGVSLAHRTNALYKIPIIYVSSNTDSKTIERVKHTEPAGFIVKPYTTKDLEMNIKLSLYKFQQKKSIINKKEENNSGIENACFVKDKNVYHKVDFGEILYIEACDNYCNVHTKSKKYFISQTLKSMEQKLVKNGFFRIHRSYLINIDKIDKIHSKCVLIGKVRMPLSESKRNALIEKIQLL